MQGFESVVVKERLGDEPHPPRPRCAFCDRAAKHNNAAVPLPPRGRLFSFRMTQGVKRSAFVTPALSPRRLLYCYGRLPPSRRGAGGWVPPLQGRGTAVKRRAVPLRGSGGGVASLREGGGILQSAGTGRFGSQNDGRRMRADGFSCALGVMLAVLFGLAFSPGDHCISAVAFPPPGGGLGGGCLPFRGGGPQ